MHLSFIHFSKGLKQMDRVNTLKTISVLSLAFLIGYFVFHVKWFLLIAGLLTLGNVLESRITALIAKYWLKFSSLIGTFNSKVILSVVFYLMLTPLAFVYRRFDKTLVNHFKNNSKDSYFDEVNQPCKKETFEKLW